MRLMHLQKNFGNNSAIAPRMPIIVCHCLLVYENLAAPALLQTLSQQLARGFIAIPTRPNCQ